VFVSDVTGHELIKMRVLNGAQTAFCTLGAILGLTYTFEDARHPVLSRLVKRMLCEETASTLPHVPGMEVDRYIDLSLSRLRNIAIRHTNHQIATDGSQKIVQRLLNPMRDRIRQGRSFDVLACAVAGFIVYLARASKACGATWAPSDPVADTVRRIADETGPSRLPPTLIVGRLAPGDVLIALLWVGGLWLIGSASKGLPWHESGNAPGAQQAPKGHSQEQKAEGVGIAKVSTGHAAIVFVIAAAVTLVCGVVLEASGSAIANQIGMTGVLFGATVLAAATSLPELSTGLAAVKLGDHKLAISDIFGGNAFLPVLFMMATLISGHSALPQLQNTDLYLAGLGILLTCVYIYGLIFRPRSRIFGMGIDSFLVLILYLIGTGGLFAIAPGRTG